MATKDKDQSVDTPIFSHEDQYVVMAAGQGGGGGKGGIGGGGGSPGGGTPGGGGSGGGNGGGKPDGEGVGNNLSFPAVFFDAGTQSGLRGDTDSIHFTTPTFLSSDTGHAFFAQGVEGNDWQAGSVLSTATAAAPLVVDYVDIGDALEAAPIKTGTNIRLELTMYEELDDPLTGFAMTVLGGAKGGGKPDKVGPTESQGAQLPIGQWQGTPFTYTGNETTPLADTTYSSSFASVYAAAPAVSAAAEPGEAEVDSYMSMSIQRVTGVSAVEDLAGLTWNGTTWVDGDGGDAITVGADIFNTSFGPELNIGGKYIMGASGKPFKFTSDGDYLITFALEDGVPVCFDGSTQVANDVDLVTLGFQPGEAEGRETWVIADDGDHNGLLVMLVGVPSSVDTGGGDEG